MNLVELDRQLAQQKASQRLQVEGGWYAVLRVPVTRSDEHLAIDLLRQASVLVHPGHFYDFPRDGYLIISLLTQPREFGRKAPRIRVATASSPAASGPAVPSPNHVGTAGTAGPAPTGDPLPLGDRAAWRFMSIASYFRFANELVSSILLRAFAYGTKTIAADESALSMLFESTEVTE